MKYGLTQDTVVTMKGLIDAITFTSYSGEDLQGTAITLNVSVRTSPFPDDKSPIGIYIKDVTAVMPARAVGDFQRKAEEFFWLYCHAPKKATVADVASTLITGLNAVRKSSARSGAAAELAFIEVLGGRDISEPDETPQGHKKIVEVRVVWWVSLGA